MNRSEEINELSAALSKAQGEMEAAVKDSDNPYFHSTYADLASVWGAIRKPLSVNGLAVMQPVSVGGSTVTVTTVLAHSSGQWMSSDTTLIAKRQLKDGGGWETLDSPQAIGSTITYARRYALAAMVGVAPEDDDGEGAEGRREQPAQRNRPSGAERSSAISEGQQKRIFALMKESGKSQAEVLSIIQANGFARTQDITRDRYDAICEAILPGSGTK